MPPTADTIAARLSARPLPPLEPARPWDGALAADIAGLGEHRFVVAALHLANDDLERAHLIAQDDEGDPTADLLHATLHRREGDYWNSKYWYAHMRAHPLVPDKQAAKAFVDACERAGKAGKAAGKAADAGAEDRARPERERQWAELRALVQWTRENCR